MKVIEEEKELKVKEEIINTINELKWNHLDLFSFYEKLLDDNNMMIQIYSAIGISQFKITDEIVKQKVLKIIIQHIRNKELKIRTKMIESFGNLSEPSTV